MNVVEPIKKKNEIAKLEKILKKQNSRDLLLFDIGINMGLRISDILLLNVCDVKNKNFIVLKEEKTKKYKKVPINEKLKQIIKEYTKDKKNNDPLFLTKSKMRMNRITAYRIIKNASRQAGLEINIGTHSLRKTFGYHFYKKFNDIAMLQKILNHSTPQITLRYIGIEQEEIDRKYENFIL